MKEALKKIEQWTKTWLVNLREKKTTYTIFSLANKDMKANLQIRGDNLALDETPTYHG
ncbi:MAG: hypothetical protein M3H12_04195 [Chromatiales bacterium]